MKLRRIFLILLFFVMLITLVSCDMGSIKEAADGSITYEGIKYVSTNEMLEIYTDVAFQEIGYMRKSIIFPGLTIYKSDNDSLLAGGRWFTNLFEKVWIKEGIEYPDDEATISQLYLWDAYDEKQYVEIGDVTFASIFTECDYPSEYRFEYYLCMTYYIEEIDTTIIKAANYLCDDFGNFYIRRGAYDEDGYYYSKCYLLDESVAYQIRKLYS